MAEGLLDKANIILTPTGYKAGTMYNVAPIEQPYEDFDFARASVASRVNSSGLIEMVGRTLGSNLVQNGDFSELGSELVTNGDFATDSDWTKGAGWSISNGKASRTAQGGSTSIYQSVSFTANKSYKITYDLDISAGSFLLRIGGGTLIDTAMRTTSGTYTEYIVANSGNNLLNLRAIDGAFVGSVTNVSVKELDPNDYWSLQNGWSLGDDEAVFSGTVSAYRKLYQTNFITIGKTYQLSFEITSITAGSIANLEPGSPSFDTVGVKTQTFVATFDDLYLEPTTNANLTITNIVVQEVIDTNNIPRINYDSNGENGHWLLEPTSTNLVPYSEDFSQWIDAGTTTVLSNITNPSGGLQSYLLSASSSSTNALRYDLSFSASTNYSYSLFFKAETSQEVRMQVYDGSSFFRLAVNPLNNFEIVDQSSINSYLIEDFENGWKRVSINITSSSSASNGYLQIYPDRTGNLNGVYIYGAQVEALSYSTSYIPTLTGSTETRATETATGAGSADLINSTEGVLYAEIAALADDGTSRQISLSSGSSATNKISLIYTSTSNQLQAFVRSSGSIAFNVSEILSDTSEFNKIALKYKQDDFSLYVNGFELATDTSGNAPSGLNVLDFDDADGTSIFYGKCKALAVFDEALTDDELTELTS
jgi:hypothetical protein